MQEAPSFRVKYEAKSMATLHQDDHSMEIDPYDQLADCRFSWYTSILLYVAKLRTLSTNVTCYTFDPVCYSVYIGHPGEGGGGGGYVPLGAGH